MTKATGSSELVERLREADRDSVQRCLGSRIFGEAADALDAKDRAIERLRDKAITLALRAGELNVALDGELKYRTHRQAVLDAMNALSEALKGQP